MHRMCSVAYERQLMHSLMHNGPVKSTVDYIIVRQEDKAKVRNVKVIPNEECVPKLGLASISI